MKYLTLELTNRCNAKCRFCINSRFKAYGDMSDEIFDKSLNDAKAFPELETIILNNIGEPFLLKNIMDKIRRVRKEFPKCKIVMFSNGSFLTTKILKEMKQIENLVFDVSLNAINYKDRLEKMGLNDFVKVKKMIDKGLKMGVINKVTIVADEPESDEFKEFIKMFPNKYILIKYANFAGSLFDTSKPRLNCNRAKKELVVLFDGTITLCCMSSLKLSFGNIKELSLKEVWNSKERQNYKIAAEKGELFGICSNCTGG